MATVPRRNESLSSPPGPTRLHGLSDQDLMDNADALLASLDRWVWMELPQRPEALIQTDQELWNAWRKLERGEKVAREDKEQLHLLGTWRSAVLQIEAVMSGKLRTMVSILWRLEQNDRADDADLLRRHIRVQFKAALPEPCPEMSAWIRGWCDYFARDTTLLPRHLRRMTRPPAEQGWKKAPAPQGGFAYAEDD